MPANLECTFCRQPTATGEHSMSSALAATHRMALCPRCSGDGIAVCAVPGRHYFRCGCGVSWSEAD